LIADAVESLGDVFSSLVVWRGLVVASEPADEDHPYGHGKAEPLAAAVVATMLLIAAAWIAVAAFRAIAEPHPAPRPFTLAVLLAVMGIKEAMFRFVSRESTSIESSAVQTDAWHHRSDAITSLAAFIGITIAIVGGKGYEAADNFAALAAALVIGWNGWHLLRPALNELMDRKPGREIEQSARAIAENVGNVKGIEKLLVRKMGHQYYIDIHVQVDPQMTVQHSHEVAHLVKDRIREQMPRVRDVLVHIEPAV
jgi:cation diffusion facilitator family transporter